MNFNGIKPISARKSMSAVTWTSAVQAGGGVAQWRAILEGHDGMWCLTFGEAGAGAERRVPCRWRSSPAAFRLPPSACRLPPVACRLPPVACRLPPLACRLPSRRLPPKDRTPHAPHRRRAFWGANRRTPIGERQSANAPVVADMPSRVEYDDLAVAASARRKKQTI